MRNTAKRRNAIAAENKNICKRGHFFTKIRTSDFCVPCDKIKMVQYKSEVFFVQYYLAIDIGASSGRHILGYVENGRICVEEIYRFDNTQLHKNGHDCWNLDALKKGIKEGLAKCKKIGKIPATVGVDTWAVDFVLLDEKDEVIGDAVAYRDSRTKHMAEKVDAIIPRTKLYEKTGIQYQPFNTIYQLTALKGEHPDELARAKSFLMIPDYINYWLTGEKCNEYTNATTTNLVNAESKTWDGELIEALGFPKEIFGELMMPGTKVGGLRPEIKAELGFDTTVILPATHDTGSAFLAIPVSNDNSVCISSGTWSLLGVENEKPITTKEGLAENFTNEGGAWYRFRYLKNIMGLWMIQSVRRELNGVSYVEGREIRSAAAKQWKFDELLDEAKKSKAFPSVVDVNRECFLSPASMTEAVKEECKSTGQPIPANVGELIQCIYHSLAVCYADSIKKLSSITGKEYTAVNIIGGGCKDEYLNELTASESGLPVYAGPSEGTAIGNLLVQMIIGRDFADLATARKAVRKSFEIKEVKA